MKFAAALILLLGCSFICAGENDRLNLDWMLRSDLSGVQLSGGSYPKLLEPLMQAYVSVNTSPIGTDEVGAATGFEIDEFKLNGDTTLIIVRFLNVVENIWDSEWHVVPQKTVRFYFVDGKITDIIKPFVHPRVLMFHYSIQNQSGKFNAMMTKLKKAYPQLEASFKR